ncbi:MAG: efflux RND transporter permease subunit [Piscinibacter sp.]|nr:efflux RND transporter permease subunit [Piscinibacter sp.]
MDTPPGGAGAGGHFNVSRWALAHPALTRYLLVVLLLLGFAAYFQLGQDEDPPFTFRAMAMRVFWPGATAQQVAEQVTDKLEKTLQEVPYADKIRSYSKPGEALIIFQVRDNSPPREMPQIWYTVRKKIGDMRGTLPGGVVGPFFNDEFGDVYGSIYALSADGFSYEELKDQADRVRQRLLKVKDVNKVAIFGAQDEKVFVEISQKRLAQLGLDFSQVLAQIGQQNAVESAGTINSPTDFLQVRVGGQFNSVDELRRFSIRANGASFKLGDIAEIRRGYVDPPQVKVHHQGQEVIALGISMAKGGDIIELGQALKATTAQIRSELPVGIELHQFQDQSSVVSRSVNEFVRVLIEAVVIVLAVSFVSLGLHFKPRFRLDWRPGAVVAVTIPLVLAITFVTMYYWGVGLHKISLGSLIIALGLLVDDAIIAVEMMVRKLEEGYDKLRAATFAYEATAMPMLTGTLITAVGFLPIGMAKSTVGEYTFAIFAVTAAALVISWLVSVYFVPYLGTRLLATKAHTNGDGEPHELFDTAFYSRFRALVNWCVKHRWITIALTVGTLVLGVVGMGKVQNQFFPDSSRLEVLVDLWYPEGTSFAANEAVTRRVEKRLKDLEGVDHVTAWVGSGAERFALVLDQIFPQSNVSQLILMPRDLAARERLRRALPELLATEFPEARARAKLLPNGPPVPYPVQFRVVGPEPAQVRAYADEVKAIMRTNPNMRGVNDNWNESVKVLRLEVDQDKARTLGVSSQAIAQSARTINSGSTIGQYRDGDKLIDIVLRQPLEERDTLTDLASGYVPTSTGRSVPLSQVVKAEFVWEPGVLWREGRDYAATVQGDIVEGLQGATVTAQLNPLFEPIRAKMRPGYRIEIAGAVEESSKGQSSIAVGLPVALFIMFTLLMLQLHSFSRSVLAFLTGFMGIAGVSGALLLLNRPFGFVALLGVIALFGMIIRNSVILIDQIEHDRERGVATWDAVVEAAVRRFRPILLTAAAAVLAMIPLSRSVFWGPMAVAIMGGLIVATALTLLALPAMYAAWFRVRPPGEERAALTR